MSQVFLLPMKNIALYMCRVSDRYLFTSYIFECSMFWNGLVAPSTAFDSSAGYNSVYDIGTALAPS